MKQNKAKLIGVFFIGIALMNFPLVELFSRNYSVLGLPGLYFSVFIIWAALIFLVKHLVDPGSGRRSKPDNPAKP